MLRCWAEIDFWFEKVWSGRILGCKKIHTRCNIFFTRRKEGHSFNHKEAMSRQEVYSWAAILSNLALFLVYIAVVFGIPSILEPYSGNVVKVIVILVIVDLVFQFVISIQGKRIPMVDRDERDDQIEGRGFKMGYYVFLVSIIVLIGHLFVVSIFEPYADAQYLEIMKQLPLHYLVFTMIAGSTAKSIVQLVHYRRGY